MKTYDVAVAGAGIVGAFVAHELARRGLSVCVIERDRLGSGASAEGMGHLVIMDGSPTELAFSAYSLRLWETLLPELPPECEFSRSGTLWVAEDDEELEAARTKAGAYSSESVIAELLDSNQLRSAEPGLNPRLTGGLRVPDDGIVYAPTVVRYLLTGSDVSSRIEVRYGRATRFIPGGVEIEDGSTVLAGQIVNAAATGAAGLTPGLDVVPKKGHLVITDRYPNALHHQVVELGYVKNAHDNSADSVACNVQPRPTGQLLIGSSRQYDISDRSIDRAILARMLDRAIHFMPGLGSMSVLRVWTGFRAATSDGCPFIGPSPAQPGVWLATGHEGLGVTTAPATAHLLADQMLERTPALDPGPFQAQRSMTHV